jgi:hypothetical protein
MSSRKLLPPARSLQQDLEQHKLQAKLATAEAQLRAAKKTNAFLGHELRLAERRFEALLSLDGSEPRTRFRIRARSKTSESVAAVQFTDWHVEERVRPGTVNGLNRFDLRVAEARIHRLVEKVIHLVRLNRAGTKVRTLVIHLGGDLMTGFLHQELVESNTLHPVQAVLWLHDKLHAVLTRLIADSGCDEIICVCNVGNHSRTTEKRRVSTRVENSYEWLLYSILSKQFPQIDWRIAKGYFEWLDVFGAKWRLHHGDDLRYQGGVGGITIPVNKAIAQWNKAQRADLDAFGHWHQSIFMRDWICNGSLIGYSAHSLSIKAEFERPTQNMWLWEKDLGRTGVWPIYLE